MADNIGNFNSGSTDISAVSAENTDGGIGVWAKGGPNGGSGLFAISTTKASAVLGYNNNIGEAVRAISAEGNGVYAESVDGYAAVFAEAGLQAPSEGSVANLFSTGVWGNSVFGRGLIGSSTMKTGVYGQSKGGNGVEGLSSDPGFAGVEGVSQGGAGVRGGSSNVGVHAFNDQFLNIDKAVLPVNHAYLGTRSLAGDFFGNVFIHGHLSKSSGSFVIDHPLDPANKLLSHSLVESPEMKNIYDGVAVMDKNGTAIVQLPGWFEAANSDFRYQLTSIGVAAPGLHISKEIKSNEFTIGGGQPHAKVSWQVTGIRKDAYALAHPLEVEQEKESNERGHYLHPQVHGAPAEKSVMHARYKFPVRETDGLFEKINSRQKKK